MMTIPNLPTDNLYKFIALTGLFIFVIGFAVPEFIGKDVRKDAEILEIEVRQNVKDYKEAVRLCYLSQKMIDEKRYNEQIEIEKQKEQTFDKAETARAVLEEKEILLNLSRSELKRLRSMSIFGVLFGWGLLFYGFILWYQKTQKPQDVILLKEQVEKFLYIHCQSCGINLISDKVYFEETNENRKKTMYCSYCFSNGHFTEPSLTLAQMKQKISNKGRELKMSRLDIFEHKRSLKKLVRWSKIIHW